MNVSTSVKATEEAWSNSRQQFKHELKNMVKKRSGEEGLESDDDVYVGTWQFFNRLQQFLRDTVTPRPTESNLDTTSNAVPSTSDSSSSRSNAAALAERERRESYPGMVVQEIDLAKSFIVEDELLDADFPLTPSTTVTSGIT